jgi:hypothetical protein
LPERDQLGIPNATDLATALQAIRALTEALRQLSSRLGRLEKRV